MRINWKLIKGGFVLGIGFGLFNFFNFIFQLIMANMLSVSDYGVLAALLSIVYLFVIFSESVQTSISNYSSKEKDNGKIKDIALRGFNRGLKLSFFLFFIYAIFSLIYSKYTKINYWLLLFNGLFIFSVFLIGISRGILQGKKKFGSLGVNMVFESLVKLGFAVFFVLLGFGVYGAIGGVLFGTVGGFLLGFIPLKEIFHSQRVREIGDKHIDYLRPAFIITSVVFIIYTIDVIIAKIFLDEFSAGAYAISSTLAKIIFFGTLPISKVMFPLSAPLNKKEVKGSGILLGSIVLMTLALIFSLFLFYFFPDKIIKIFSGKEIFEASKVLFLLGLAISFVSLANIILLYKLSRNIVRGYSLLVIFPLMELIILSLFSSSIYSFSWGFVISSFIFLIGSILVPNILKKS